MKRLRHFFLFIIFSVTSTGIFAQSELVKNAGSTQVSCPFCSELYNQEYDIFMCLDLYGRSLEVPAHELFGPLPGYLGKTTSSFYWLVLDAEIDGRKATLQMVNDFGSEDLLATLTQENDSTFRLVQKKGSSIKVPYKGKWMKLPAEMDFKVRNYRKSPVTNTP